jgi:hypothetical protein
MANFTAVKLGGWAFREKLGSTQMSGLQEMLLKCPNMSEGSNHVLVGSLVVDKGVGGADVVLRTSGQLGNDLSSQWHLKGVFDCVNGAGRIAFDATYTSSLSGNLQRSSADPQIEVFPYLGASDRFLTLYHIGAVRGDTKIYLNADSVNRLSLGDESAGALATISPHGIGIAVWIPEASRWFACAGS